MSRGKQAQFICVAFSLLAVGCGKDKTLDQYQNDQANAQCAQLQYAAGDARGTLTPQSSGQPIGAMELKLTTTQVPVNNGSGTGNIGKCTLQGAVRVVMGSAQTSAVVNSGSYVPSADDPAVGSLTLTLGVATGAGLTQQATFNLTGHFSHGRITGVVAPGNFTGTSANFVVEQGAPLPHVGQGSTDPDAPAGIKTYAGTYVNQSCLDPQFRNTIFCRGTDPNHMPVMVTMNFTPDNTGSSFVNLFADQKTVLIDVTMAQHDYALQGALYDVTAGTVFYKGVLPGDTFSTTFNCNQLSAGSFHCSYMNSAHGQNIEFNLSQVR